MDQETFARHVDEIAKAARDGKGASLLICKPNGQLVGGVTLGPIINEARMLGTWIGTPFVNQGYAIRAVDVVLRIAFDVLGLKCVAASVLPDNDPSIRILEWFGFDHDPSRNLVMRVADEPRLHLMYVVNRHGWNVSSSRQQERRISRERDARNADGEQGAISGHA